ncbi:UDP-galactose transporter [Symbiodinium microadriaticum]|uniref:UDP-galactose transporter n=1 Tax=Symbiodinium microadriaticum TaxID=2951 RepID=A0A1Q9CA28_SYMMI|nr:UDP-galactose transporter [Symbiodinium microadriaticum]
MFTDWLDAGPLDYSSLAVAFTPWARGAGSDAQAAKKAAARAAPVEEPGQELLCEVRQRRRLLPEWLKRTTQSEGEEVKGWWRKGPRFDHRFAEIRTGEKNQIELIWLPGLIWQSESGLELSRSRTEKGLKRIPLQGVAWEPFALDGLFGFRLLPLPQDGDSVDLATKTASERDLWTKAIAVAAAQRPSDGSPVAGTLKVRLLEATVRQETSWRRQTALWVCWLSPTDPLGRRPTTKAAKTMTNAALLGRTGKLTSASRPCDLRKNLEGDGTQKAVAKQAEVKHVANYRFNLHLVGTCFKLRQLDASGDFTEALEFPLEDDDPDALIQVEVWSSDGRSRGALRGRVDVPLYCMRELQLPVRDLHRPRGEGSQVGFHQSLGALLLPRPSKQATTAWQTVGGDKSIREQFRELEAFMQQFEVFSSRFGNHCFTSRSLSMEYRRIIQWDSPLLTLLCLLALTIQIGFFHEYVLPVVVLVVLGVVLWYHPVLQRYCGSWEQWWEEWLQCVKNLPSEALTEDGPPEERYENERRLVLGRRTLSSIHVLWEYAYDTGVYGKPQYVCIVASGPAKFGSMAWRLQVCAVFVVSVAARLHVAFAGQVMMAMKPLMLHLTGSSLVRKTDVVALPPAFFQMGGEALKVAMCVVALLLRRAFGLSAVVWNGWKHTASFAIPAAVYLLMNVLTVSAARMLNPPMLQLLATIKILFTAAASWLLMQRRLQPIQWFALVLLTVGVALGGQGRTLQDGQEIPQAPVLGIVLMVINSALSALGAVSTEMALKMRTSADFTIFATNLHLALHSLALTGSGLLIWPSEPPRLEALHWPLG